MAQKASGIEGHLEQARANMRVDEYLNFPQAQDDRERYWRHFSFGAEAPETQAPKQ